jgi:3',5'-cyclic AMP phosphodiesterase CpdA
MANDSSSPHPCALLQISDPHFGTEVGSVVVALIALVRQLAPSLVVISGDITQRARRSQFAAAHQFVSQLSAARVIAIPGNHDIPLFNPIARFCHPYANYARCFGDELEPEFESDRLLVLCAKTTRRRRHKDGEVSEEQIERISRRLRQAKSDQLRIVVTHQPVHVIRTQDLENLLHGHEAAVREWSQAGVDVMMGGHIHLPYIRPLSERFSDLSRGVWVVQAGTAVSHRIRDGVPNSVNVIRYPIAEAGHYGVERWDYDGAGERFERIEQHRMLLDRT